VNIANVSYLEKGSSLKFCSLAEGSANLYPRLSPTMEWDTAAGHAIALHAGCHVLEFESGAPLRYNKKSLLNQWFIVSRMEKSVTANIR
jgi:3'(2'), 5'-bisphosphate nucleotidase